MDFDYLIVGSGFGGSVCGLRLAEKGYRVVMLERGRRFRAEDFPKSNWDLRRWMWMPQLGWRGLFKMTFLPHLTALTGVGVGGGSLVYANTLPVPKEAYFEASSWAGLAAWKRELMPHYETAQRMLGATEVPRLAHSDEALRQVAADRGQLDRFAPSRVGVFFGEPDVTVPDPYFGGGGPARTGCNSCGACMIGCPTGAKNTLDRNYLFLAERKGLQLLAEHEVVDVRPLAGGGYEVSAMAGDAAPWTPRRQRRSYTAANVVFSGGVLGTVPLLLGLKKRRSLPHLSDQLGAWVRTNSESLLGVVSRRRDVDTSQGVAISSILHTDDHSHIEPVRYPAGSGFFRVMMAPHVAASGPWARAAETVATIARNPLNTLRAMAVDDWAKRTTILLYMRTFEGALRLRLGRAWTTGFTEGLITAKEPGTPSPTASIPEATELARAMADKLDGMPMSLVNETLLDIPTTAHILGGCCIGGSPERGVIDARHQVFGYPGLFVVDGSAISANPGVNPALSITALAERAMSFVPEKR